MYDMDVYETGGNASTAFANARRLATCGFATIPIPAGQKRPSLKGWPGLATTDETAHRGWFGSGLPSNIGIATGEKSNVFVLDVDVKDGGLASLAALEAEHGALPATPQQDTPTGGKHFMFRPPVGMVVKNSARKLAPGLDVRGEGGQIVAAPSTHPNGGRYTWARGWRLGRSSPPRRRPGFLP